MIGSRNEALAAIAGRQLRVLARFTWTTSAADWRNTRRRVLSFGGTVIATAPGRAAARRLTTS
jgi:hypothetical protein